MAERPGTAVRIDFKQRLNLQKEDEKSVESSSSEHSAVPYGLIGSRPTDDLFDDDGRVTVIPSGAYYNVSNFAAMNAARVKVSEIFNLTGDHFALKEETRHSPSTKQTLQAVKREREKTKSVVAPSTPLHSQSIGQLQSASLGFCMTKSHQRVKVTIGFSTAKEIFKSADDSNNITGSEGLELFTVRCECFVSVYYCHSSSCCRVVYLTLTVVMVTMKTGLHWWALVVMVFMLLVTVSY